MKNQILLVIGAIFILVGIVLLFWSATYDRYTNEQEYQNKYFELNNDKNRSAKFNELRKEYLTPKFELEDYGFTFCILSIPCILISSIGITKIKTLQHKSYIIAIGFLAALFTSIGFVGDLYLEMYRESYPHWADSMIIPLMTVPFLLITSLLWVAINSIGLKGSFKTSVRIFPVKFDNLNYWYLIILILTTILLCSVIIIGNFLQILSGLLWAYFYLNILLGIRQAKLERIGLSF